MRTVSDNDKVTTFGDVEQFLLKDGGVYRLVEDFISQEDGIDSIQRAFILHELKKEIREWEDEVLDDILDKAEREERFANRE